MVTREEFAELVSAVQTLEIQVSALEANQRNAESSTTRCSAAGCGIEHSKPDRSAGREPLQVYKSWLEDKHAFLKGVYDQWGSDRTKKELEIVTEHYKMLLHIIGERR